MKGKLRKKLVLNKKTISNLSEDEMQQVWGATLFAICTDSCSLFALCCPTTQENILQQNLGQG